MGTAVQPQSMLQRYRDSHHQIAEMFALGMTPSMIRRQTGISMHRLSLYAGDPAFNELIAQKQSRLAEKTEAAADAYLDAAIANMLRAERQIMDHLDEAEEKGELLPVNILDKISQGRADRFGYSKHSTMKVEHDFATALDRAIARSGKGETIEGRVEAAGATPALDMRVLDVEASHAPQALPLHTILGSAEPAPVPATQASASGGGGTGLVGKTQPQSPRSFSERLAEACAPRPIKRRRLA